MILLNYLTAFKVSMHCVLPCNETRNYKELKGVSQYKRPYGKGLKGALMGEKGHKKCYWQLNMEKNKVNIMTPVWTIFPTYDTATPGLQVT